MTHRTELKTVSARTQKLHRCSSRLEVFLQVSSILRKTEIRKSVRVTEPQTFLTKPTFQQQQIPAFPSKQISQSLKHNSRNRSTESQNQRTVSKSAAQVIYQTSVDPRDLPKLKLTEFSEEALCGPRGQNFSMSLFTKSGLAILSICSIG